MQVLQTLSFIMSGVAQVRSTTAWQQPHKANRNAEREEFEHTQRKGDIHTKFKSLLTYTKQCRQCILLLTSLLALIRSQGSRLGFCLAASSDFHLLSSYVSQSVSIQTSSKLLSLTFVIAVVTFFPLNRSTKRITVLTVSICYRHLDHLYAHYVNISFTFHYHSSNSWHYQNHFRHSLIPLCVNGNGSWSISSPTQCIEFNWAVPSSLSQIMQFATLPLIKILFFIIIGVFTIHFMNAFMKLLAVPIAIILILTRCQRIAGIVSQIYIISQPFPSVVTP